MKGTRGRAARCIAVGIILNFMVLPSTGEAICGSPAIDPDTVIVPPELRKAVQRGDTEALYTVGMLYEGSAPATKLLMRAAKQGHAGAQNMIGLSYAHECRLEQDDVQAYMWFALAVERGLTEAQGNLDFVMGRMSSKQIEQARQLVREWRPVEKADEK